jgi:hypothetical protein
VAELLTEIFFRFFSPFIVVLRRGDQRIIFKMIHIISCTDYRFIVEINCNSVSQIPMLKSNFVLIILLENKLEFRNDPMRLKLIEHIDQLKKVIAQCIRLHPSV